MTTLTTYLTSRRGLFVAALIAVIALAAACSDPTPTPTPTPTPSPTPTPTATPTPTPTPAPTATPTPTPESAMPGNGGMTAGDILGTLTEAEQACVLGKLGAAAVNALLNQPLDAIGGEFPLDCVSSENAANIAIALMGESIGGLTPESEACLREVYAASGAPLMLGEGDGDLASLLDFLPCLTDEEAAALVGDDFLTPTQVRCIIEQVGEEKLRTLFSGLTADAPSPDALAIIGDVMQGFAACGIDPVVMSPGAGGFSVGGG